MFWGKGNNFLTPDTFNNVGDSSFPLNAGYVNSFLYGWDNKSGFGLGSVNLSPFMLPSYLFVWIWTVIGLPLWIANRLWHVFPNILIGLGALYLYRSLFNEKYSRICGTIASFFIMLLPDRHIFPHGSLGFAGSLFILGAFIRGLLSRNFDRYAINNVIVFSFGVGMAIYYPRCLYIAFIICIIMTALSVYSNFKKRQKSAPVFRFIKYCLILTALLNSFWILPLSLQITQGKSSLFFTNRILDQRETFSREHQKITNPVYILRATTGGEYMGRPAYYYFSHPLVLPFSFLVPVFCFLPLLIEKFDKKTKLLSFSAVFLLLYPFSFHISPKINLLLRKHIPTFWIMNDPTYWLLYVGACYGLIIASMTEYYLIQLENRKIKPLRKFVFGPRTLRAIFIGFVFAVAIIFGGGILIDRPLVPGFHSKFTLYYTKLPYVKIPVEYDSLKQYLAKIARTGDRIWYIDIGNYKTYTWYSKGHQPEILFFKSPIPAVGRPLAYAMPIIDLLSDSIDPKKYFHDGDLKLALFMANALNIRYILAHKDYLEQQDIDLNEYARENIGESGYFKVAMDTDKFILYENKNLLSAPIYASQFLIPVVGNLGSLVELVRNGSLMEKPAFILSEQITNKKSANFTLEFAGETSKSAASRKHKLSSQDPVLTFKKINPAKFLVKVGHAHEPFWLIFNESFYNEWKIYKASIADYRPEDFAEITTEYLRLAVKEAKPSQRFIPFDIRYLFRRPLDAQHQLVNGYANGWYIDPKKIGTGEDFTLVLYLWPQSLLYLGQIISGATMIGCVGYFLSRHRNEK